ncbi:hypothetical protein J7M02_07670 [Candidatus Aerophobetes bacterium]|nr:hypothetical protein [Candidatus Aerophobetes bacterium]
MRNEEENQCGDSGRSRLSSQFILIGRSGGWMDISLGMSTLLLIYGFMKAVDRSIEEEKDEWV